jgi:hypothetical protein
MRGWDGLLLPELTVPAELPETAGAFQAQQYRWAKGSLQTARRLLPAVWRSRLRWPVKIQATIHLTQYFLHPLLVLLALLTPWMAFSSRLSFGSSASWQLLIAVALVSTTYWSAQRLLARPWSTALSGIGALLLAGTCSALGSTRAAVEALAGRRSDFVRTPKRGASSAGRYRMRRVVPLWWEGFFAAYCLVGIGVCLFHGWVAAVPMLFFCASGSIVAALLDRASGLHHPSLEIALEPAARNEHGHVSV